MYVEAEWEANSRLLLLRSAPQYKSLSESDMRAVNIGVPSDVGDWLCQQLREDLCACDAADRLAAYFTKFCSKF